MRILLTLASAASLAAAPAAAQVVHGRVVAAGGDSAVAAALVRLLPERGADSVATRADSLGRFTLRAPGGGDYRIAAARVGFREAVSPEFELEEGDSLEVRFRLAPDTVLLNPLEVVATSRRRPARLEEFHRRAGRDAFGWFVTREEIDRRAAIRTTDLLWTAPGLHLVPSRRGFGYALRGRGGCVPAVYLDGMRIGAGSVDLWTDPDELEGIEVYAGAGAPVEYAGPGAGCAVVLLWTRF